MSPEPTASKDNLATAASSASSAEAGQRERQSMTIRYVDRADMAETFADSITGLVFDGQTLRIEFGVTRLDDVKANAPRTARRYPACRLVLSPATAVELINRMQQIGAALTQAGVVKAAPAKAG
jgi:alpha-D-ribose 1-methylphosphonate 5-triphosphate synthase subunit PhnI